MKCLKFSNAPKPHVYSRLESLVLRSTRTVLKLFEENFKSISI